MNQNKKSTSTKKTFIQYAILAVVVMGLYLTGLHTEVIGFVQRGLLATGLMKPNMEQPLTKSSGEVSASEQLTAADFNLKLQDVNGDLVSLEEMKGKVIFINVWATWCPPCIAEMPNINNLKKEMGDEVVFVMLSMDDDFEKAKAFINRKEFDLPIYALASSLPEMYESTAIPSTFVISAAGNLAMSHKGMADYNNADFKKFLRSLK